MDIKILVASHKKAEMPEDSMYLPVHVGRALYPDKEFGYQSDAEGDNISITLIPQHYYKIFFLST